MFYTKILLPWQRTGTQLVSFVKTRIDIQSPMPGEIEYMSYNNCLAASVQRLADKLHSQIRLIRTEHRWPVQFWQHSTNVGLWAQQRPKLVSQTKMPKLSLTNLCRRCRLVPQKGVGRRRIHRNSHTQKKGYTNTTIAMSRGKHY